MKKLILFIMGAVCILSSCKGQPPSKEPAQVPLSKIVPLNIGDTVPDVVFRHMLNYKDSTARLSDFKGKPIILDFFATWCGSCIEALPSLDSLQNYFRNNVRVFVVDYEKPKKVRSFLENNPIGKRTDLAFVTADSILNTMFPHKSMPHEVIIDGTMKVQAITYSDYITIPNIQKLLNGHILDLPIKKELMTYSVKKPLFYYGNGGSLKNIYQRSTFCNYISGITTRNGIARDSNHIRLYFNNMPILWLYYVATNAPVNANRIILEVEDTTHYIRNRDIPLDQWNATNTYCYELIAPANTPMHVLHKYMFEDLNRYLHINGRFEKRRIQCWALKRISKSDSLFRTKGGKRKLEYGTELPVQIFRNIPISKLVILMNSTTPTLPLRPIVIDETNYTGNVDLNLAVDDIQDIQEMRKALENYGLTLVPVQRMLNMLVLTEEDFNSH